MRLNLPSMNSVTPKWSVHLFKGSMSILKNGSREGSPWSVYSLYTVLPPWRLAWDWVGTQFVLKHDVHHSINIRKIDCVSSSCHRVRYLSPFRQPDWKKLRSDKHFIYSRIIPILISVTFMRSADRMYRACIMHDSYTIHASFHDSKAAMQTAECLEAHQIVRLGCIQI